MARLADDLEQTRRVARGEEGRLTVGFSGSVMFTELPAAIQAYRRAYPRVEVQLREMWTSDSCQRWRMGRLMWDFCGMVSAGRSWRLTPLLREPFHVVLPADHRCDGSASWTRGRSKANRSCCFPGAWATWPLIGRCAAAWMRASSRQIAQEAPQFPTLIRLVAAGLGISLVPGCVATITFPGAFSGRSGRSGGPRSILERGWMARVLRRRRLWRRCEDTLGVHMQTGSSAILDRRFRTGKERSGNSRTVMLQNKIAAVEMMMQPDNVKH